jgi:hypothetical protein
MKRIRLISIAVALILIGLLAFSLFRSKEPSYQGRSLTEWIEKAESAQNKSGFDQIHPETDPDFSAASHAVQAMGPAAIPFLLRWAQANDSRVKDRIWEWAAKHSSFQELQMNPAWDRHLAAVEGFSLLGSKAKTAWPILIKWTYSTDNQLRLMSLLCLTASKPDQETFMPVLKRLMHDPDREIQSEASLAIHTLYPQEAEAAGVYKMFPELKHLPTIHTSTNQTQPGK